MLTMCVYCIFTNTNFALSPLYNQITSRKLRHLAAPVEPLAYRMRSIFEKIKKKGQVKYNTIYAFGENNESGIRSSRFRFGEG